MLHHTFLDFLKGLRGVFLEAPSVGVLINVNGVFSGHLFVDGRMTHFLAALLPDPSGKGRAQRIVGRKTGWLVSLPDHREVESGGVNRHIWKLSDLLDSHPGMDREVRCRKIMGSVKIYQMFSK